MVVSFLASHIYSSIQLCIYCTLKADPAVIVVSMWIAASIAQKEAIFRQNINVHLGNNVKTLIAALGTATVGEYTNEKAATVEILSDASIL
jgi:hypothetical protein